MDKKEREGWTLLDEGFGQLPIANLGLIARGISALEDAGTVSRKDAATVKDALSILVGLMERAPAK